jgi:hypothetical protein
MNRMQRHEEVRVFREGLASPNVPAARVSFGLDPSPLRGRTPFLRLRYMPIFMTKSQPKYEALNMYFDDVVIADINN